MFTKRFWCDAAERSIKSFAQGCLSVLTVSATPLLDLNWYIIGSAGALNSIYSVLTSVASAPVGQKESGSLLK